MTWYLQSTDLDVWDVIEDDPTFPTKLVDGVMMITRFTDIVNGLEALGKTYKESKKVMKILGSLPSKWHTKKLQEGEDKKKKSIALKATTKEKEDVEEEKPSEEDDDLALITRKLNKYMRGERFKGRKFTSRRDLSKKESSSHGDKEKWEEKRDLDSKNDKWFLDSGYSRYMTGDESKFAFLTKRKGGHVTFGDNAKGRIIGQCNIDTSSLIESVLLVDGLKHNLLSIVILCDKGFKVIFEASHCIIKDNQNDKTIFIGHRCDNVYAINISKYDGHDDAFQACIIKVGCGIGGFTITYIRSDHRREFENIDFEEYCNEHGINHNFSAPITPQQNGVVERKNRTLQEMARTMLNENNLPKYFWAQDVNTSCYVLNRILLRPIFKKTPYELWKNKKANISFFKVFGCKCFILNTKDNLEKFDAKSDVGIFHGYSTSSKAFRVFNKRTMVVEESIHVIFYESNNSLQERESFVDDLGMETSMGKLQIEYGRQQEEIGENPKKEESPLALPQEIGEDLNKCKVNQVKTFLKIGSNPSSGVRTRSSLRNICNNLAFISQIEPKNINDTIVDESWMIAMQEELNQFERSKGFLMGKIDTTLFIKTKENDTLLYQIYVDDIIFGATNISLYEEFSRCMHSEFEMTMIGELNFFIGLQIKQLKEGTFMNQAKYIKDLLKRFNMEETKTMKTLMISSIKLDKNEKVTISKPIFSTLVREFYSRVTYGLGGPNISTVRGVEIQLDPESIYRIFDIAPIGLRFEGVQFEAPFSESMMFELVYTTRPYSQPSFTESPHTEPSPHQAPHVLDHAPWMDLSTQISSIGTRMEELVVVSDTRFYSMEDHMDQYQTGFTSQFEYLQQRFERMEDRMNQQQTAFDHL
uniref:Integrase catalytic domain-containing protein n=1 Tax=Vitis vinifera TaxID=29760 RepID=A5AD70_VITVI|nr:hypothetical protein VITISV_020597 [Vitis vinifera]